eukprot:gene32474-40078_t
MPKIYAWEEENKPTSGALQIDNILYTPTTTNGFYNRSMGSPAPGTKSFFSRANTLAHTEQEVQPSDKYCDFQIVLTLEELTTLASRKKSEVRGDSKLHRSQAAATSVHSTTPYIENRRIVQAMLRPNAPEKWISKDGLRAYQRN